MRRFVSTLVVLVGLALLVSCSVDGPAGPLEMRSFGEFSRVVRSDSVGCAWNIVDGAPSCVLVTEVREGGSARWEGVLLERGDSGWRSTFLFRGAGGWRPGSARVVSLGNRPTVALTLDATTGGESLVGFYPVPDDGTEIDIDHPAARVDTPSFVREADWSLVDLNGHAWIVYADGPRLIAGEIAYAGGRLQAGEPWVLFESEFTVATPALDVDEATGSLGAGWREFVPGGESRVRAGLLDSAEPGIRLRDAGTGDLGSTQPFTGAGSTGAEYLGSGVTFESRRLLAVRLDGSSLVLAASAVTRPRTQLSEFQVEPRVYRFSRSADVAAAAPPVVTPILPAEGGVVDGFFHFAERDGSLAVGFLRERPGPTVETAYFAAVVGAEGVEPVVRTPIDSPRRLSAPHLFDSPGGVVWLQADPLRDGWQAGYRDSEYSYMVDAGLVWHGHPGETVATTLLSIPLATILALFWGVVGNAPLVGAIVLAAGLVFRFAPELVRRDFGALLVSFVAVSAALAGVPTITLSGPAVPAVARLGVGLLVMLYAWRISRGTGAARPRVPQPGDLIRWSTLTVITAVATSAYAYALVAIAGSS